MESINQEVKNDVYDFDLPVLESTNTKVRVYTGESVCVSCEG